jgi:Xaa-Pro aminopeptidase
MSGPADTATTDAASGEAAESGAAELADLIAEAGLELEPGEAEARLAGIAAAPEPRREAAALDILGEGLPETAAARLRALARARRAIYAAMVRAGPAPPERLRALRAELARRGLDGFVVPLSDEHHNEYVPPRARRLAWLTGFTGSAGLALVLADRAVVFADGRYTLQVREQVDEAAFTIEHLTENPPDKWLAANLGPGAKLGYDPWLHTLDGLDRLRKACESADSELVACEANPLDAVWRDQPPPPLSPMTTHGIEFAGESAADKRARIAEILREAGNDAAVLTDPSSIAWLLNVRGGDVGHSPLPLSFAILRADASAELFVDGRKLGPALGDHLGDAVITRPPEELGAALDDLGQAGISVRLDPATAGAWVHDRLVAAGARVAREPDPCALPKAIKNTIELAGARAAHRRDGAALTRFLAWLEEAAAGGEIDELAAAARLEGFRAQDPSLRDLSFTTISGAGPNGAIVHYGVTPESNRRLEPGTLYLVDSGGQYPDGTTDVTRTVAIGAPTPEHRARFTAVLKGHIALAATRFPEGTTGSQLDTLARHALWQAGLDYDHGTGHGVGAYLGVHEGPHRISKLPNAIALKPGMIVSNEPGYYKSGAYGIRIENLVTVIECHDIPGAEKTMLAFETLTKAPIDLNLVALEQLTGPEAAWLDAYHADVRTTLAPLLKGEDAAWLEHATRPLDDTSPA